MEKFSIILLLITILGCSEKRFIRSEVLAQYPNDTIYYDACQTGVDNYEIEFKSKSGRNVERLFYYHINDGILSQTKLRASTIGDSVIILSKYPVDNQNAQTKQGIFVSMRKL